MIDLKKRVGVDQRGKITTGIKKTNDAGVEYPTATDYFVIDEFPELKAIYGEKPNRLMIVFPKNQVDTFFTADNVLYGSNHQQLRKCNGGDECIHKINEEIDLVGKYDDTGQADEDGNPLIIETAPYKEKYEAGEITQCICKLMPQTIINQKTRREIRNPKLCRCAMYLKAYVVNYKTGKLVQPTCYMFYSGSENTASNIYSKIDDILSMFGGKIAGMPFALSVKMVSSKMEANKKYPVWELQALGTMEILEQAAQAFLLDYKQVLKDGKTLPEHADQKQIAQASEEPAQIIEEEPEITETPGTTETNIQELIERENDPNYWISEINKLPLVPKEIDKFESVNKLQLSVFSGPDEEAILKALADKRSRCKKDQK